MPLWTIFVKWPAPDGADVRPAVLRRQRLEDRRSRFTGALSPPTIRQKPTSSPQMPPETPTSTNATFRLRASLYRRCESRKFELPPSTIVSPGSRMPSSFWNVSSVIFPDGTISQTCRGGSSCFASARSVFAVEATFGSYDFISWPCCSSRSVIPEPIRPRPTMPSCI